MPGPRVQHRFQGELEEKKCSKCDDWKVLKVFYKEKKKWDGLQSQCKVCKNIAREKQRRKLGMKPKRTEHRFQGALEEEQCSTCKKWKALIEFGKHKRTCDGLQSQCKVCANIAQKNRRRKLGMKPQRTEHRFQGELEEKKCSKCDDWKVLKEFHQHNKVWDGLSSWCKGCTVTAYKKKISTEHGIKRLRSQRKKAKRK